MDMKNPYLPIPMEIEDIIDEVDTKDIKTFRLRFVNEEDKESFSFISGQFAEISVNGKGESPIGIASSPMDRNFLEFTINRAGVVTTALHNMEPGAKIGIRGPLGNGWPIDILKGKTIVIVGGGFAFTTQRSLINYILHPENRADFGKIMVFYGARTPGLLLYKDELLAWEKEENIEPYITVDRGDDTWKGYVGVVPKILEEIAPSPENAVAIVCGPPIMIHFTLPVLYKLGFKDEYMYTSLENRMKCGIGKCGRCNVGPKYVCKDGPVFSYAELRKYTTV